MSRKEPKKRVEERGKSKRTVGNLQKQEKRILGIVLLLTLLAGCGSSKTTTQSVSQSANGNAGQKSGISRTIGVDNGAPDPEPGNGLVLSHTAGIDIDLLSMSNTMVYTVVYSIVVSPEEFVGKTIRMRGQSLNYRDETTGTVYHSCVIQDATACCSQGIEYVLTNSGNYPAKDGEEITVTGKLETYSVGDFLYCTLKNATIERE